MLLSSVIVEVKTPAFRIPEDSLTLSLRPQDTENWLTVAEATEGPQLTPITQIPEEGVVLAQAHSPAGSSRSSGMFFCPPGGPQQMTLSQHCFSLRAAKWIPQCYKLNCVCVCVRVCMCMHSVAECCPTLCNPVDCGLSGSSVHEILQSRILEWAALSYSRGSNKYRQFQASCVQWSKKKGHQESGDNGDRSFDQKGNHFPRHLNASTPVVRTSCMGVWDHEH